MLTLLSAVFVTSFAGSVHCVGMCGVFAAIAAGGEGPGRMRVVSYNLARLAVYLPLGILAGALGNLLDAGGNLAGLQRASAVSFALFLIGAGVMSLTSLRGWIPSPRLPDSFQQGMRSLQRAAAALPAAHRAAAIGVVNALMPCGWLWTFVACAGSTGSALGGGLVMFTFWLGGLPAMVFTGAGARRAAGALPRAPALVATLWTAAGWMVLRMPELRPLLPAPSSGSLAALETEVTSMDPADRCCHAKGSAPR